MQVEIKDGGYVLFFGIPAFTAAIVLSGVIVGRYFAPSVQVQVQVPEIREQVSVYVPEQPAPTVTVQVPEQRQLPPPTVIVQEIITEKAVVAPVEVHVPAQGVPVVNLPERISVTIEGMPHLRVFEHLYDDGSRRLQTPADVKAVNAERAEGRDGR